MGKAKHASAAYISDIGKLAISAGYSFYFTPSLRCYVIHDMFPAQNKCLSFLYLLIGTFTALRQDIPRPSLFLHRTHFEQCTVYSAKRWRLGCVNLRPGSLWPWGWVHATQSSSFSWVVYFVASRIFTAATHSPAPPHWCLPGIDNPIRPLTFPGHHLLSTPPSVQRTSSNTAACRLAAYPNSSIE